MTLRIEERYVLYAALLDEVPERVPHEPPRHSLEVQYSLPEPLELLKEQILTVRVEVAQPV